MGGEALRGVDFSPVGRTLAVGGMMLWRAPDATAKN